jgi:hypothetical protein
MDRSPYLAQALQAMQQAPQAPMQPSINPEQLAAVVKQRKAFQQANPGQSFMAHNLGQAGRNLMAAPGNVMSNLQQLPGLFGLGQKAMR